MLGYLAQIVAENARETGGTPAIDADLAGFLVKDTDSVILRRVIFCRRKATSLFGEHMYKHRPLQILDVLQGFYDLFELMSVNRAYKASNSIPGVTNVLKESSVRLAS